MGYGVEDIRLNYTNLPPDNAVRKVHELYLALNVHDDSEDGTIVVSRADVWIKSCQSLFLMLRYSGHITGS